MIQFNSIFNFEFLNTESPKWRFLIGTSANCPWCEHFKDAGMWEVIEEGIKDDYEVCIFDIDKVGGPKMVAEGFLYFLGQRVAPGEGYPALYIVGGNDVKYIMTDVYWDRDAQRFKTEGLIEYLKKEKIK